MQQQSESNQCHTQTQVWAGTMPANIALIKYMGKTNADNQSTNHSLSYTLNHLTSTASLTLNPTATQDCWQADPHHPLPLSHTAQQRYLNHLSCIKQLFGITQTFTLISSNNFPHACGLASSASSFAALTVAAAKACCELTNSTLPKPSILANWSRLGSGSSCRSFFAPFALWTEAEVQPCTLPYSHLMHALIIIDRSEKTVSSSEAHQRVRQSSLFNQRPLRANQRCAQLIQALTQQDWQQAYQITWQEFQDMHALYHTAAPPFSYLKPNTIYALNQLSDFWQKHQDGPLITMDAGCNIHLLFRPSQTAMLEQLRVQLKPLIMECY
jgi:diphosphomevalonate decarboxylase